MSGSSSTAPVASSSRRAVRRRPPASRSVKPAVDLDDPVVDELDAVAADLGPPGGEQLGGRHPVARQEALHVRGGRVARRAGVDDGDPAPRPAEHERRAQPGGAAADHHHVVGLGFHALDGARSAVAGATFVAVSGNGGSVAVVENSPAIPERAGRGRPSSEAAARCGAASP